MCLCVCSFLEMLQVSGPQNNHRESEEADAHGETNPNVNTSEVEQDDEIDDQDDERIEYTEDDSNNNPDGEYLNDRNGDNLSRSMPNENFNDAANSTQDGQNAADNHKNSPSDEEFYGGPSTGWFFQLIFCSESQFKC